MKNPILQIVALAGALTGTFFCSPRGLSAPDAAPGNATAYRAIRVARATLGAEALKRMVEVTGRDGVPQPYLWKIVLKDGAAGSKEIDIAGGKIVAQRTPSHPPATSGLVKLDTLNLDSSGAFDAADAQSRKARVRFDSVNYTLRAGENGQPVWTMELFNQDGAGVGTMRLTATDGTIASIDGRLANAPGRPSEPMTASTIVAPPPTVTTTTTVQTTTVPPPAPASEVPPPPVHDVDNPAPPSAVDSEGGFFTRAGRTIDHTQDHVARSIGNATDNVAHSIDTANEKVKHSLQATGAKLESFFGAHGDRD